MERRNFLQSLGLAAGAAAEPAFGSTTEAKDWTPEAPPAPSRVVVLTSNPITGSPGGIIRAVGVHTLERTADALPTDTSIKMTGAVVPGERHVSRQNHTGCSIPSHGYLNGEPFDLSYYERRLAHWAPRDAATAPRWPEEDDDAQPVADVFRGISHVGLARLPQGLIWAGHFIDTKTGLAMRGLALYDIMLDRVVLRFDILWG